MDSQRQAAGDPAARTRCGSARPDGEQNRRRALTRDRVVAEALAIISADGAAALSMRALAARLGVVPAALYRHVTSKEQLYDLILDGVLAEVDCRADPALPWPGRSPRSRTDCGPSSKTTPASPPCSRPATQSAPHSLALAEAFLAPLQAAGLPGRQAALAFRLIFNYTLGFALSDRTSHRRAARPGQRHQSTSCTPSCAPCPPAGSPHSPPPSAHTPRPGDRDQRFTASLDTLIRRPAGNPPPPAPATPPSQLKRDPPGQLAQMAGREHPRRCRDRHGRPRCPPQGLPLPSRQKHAESQFGPGRVGSYGPVHALCLASVSTVLHRLHGQLLT